MYRVAARNERGREYWGMKLWEVERPPSFLFFGIDVIRVVWYYFVGHIYKLPVV